ncbi:hypothetical protein [Sphingobium chungbukense]|uniref:hypothetical protein n=1 Tax=Sphingobium chungbukense TaxID=56193 RepID=UPI000AF1E65A|nr:hypothetical protein [Sphingobium chungbukense]
MSKTLRTVALVAGAVALVATGVGAAASIGAIGVSSSAAAAGVAGLTSASILATATTVATVASAVGMAASIGAQITAKKPPARGTVNEVIISAEPPAPYMMGRTYSGGVLRHDVGYGATLKKVPNPYRGQVIEYSVAGPCDGLENIYVDYSVVPFAGGAATGYYSGYLYRDVRVGLTTETALTPHFAGMPNWTSNHKLSSKAAILLNGKFDKDGKRFASGWPATGAVWRGVKTYDARKDSTYPGGSGAHRINDESTWEYSEDPGQHALAYALGRFRNGKKVFGVGLPVDGIIVEHFVELSNVCQANGWKVGGVIYEPGDRWANLKRILEAGGAEPLFIGGKLGLRINAPRVSIYDLTASDLTEDDAEIPAAKTWRERRNGIRPKYRSEANKWTYVSSDLVSIPSYITEDGEEKFEELQWDLVQNKDQVAKLAAYRLVNGREIGPITLVCKPHMRTFGPGDMITLNLGADHALGGMDAVILKRSVDPGSMKVTLTLETETAGKHDFALGRTGTAPPSPALAATEDKDVIAAEVIKTDEIPWTGVLDDDPDHPKPEDGATVGMTDAEALAFAQLDADTAAATAAVATAQSEIDTAVAAIAAQGTAISTIEANVATNSGDIELLAEQIRALSTEAMAELSNKLGVMVTDNESVAGALLAATIKTSEQSAAFSSERTIRANSEEVIARSVDAINVRMGAAEAGISSEATIRATADTALSNRIDTLTATVGDNTASINAEASTRATADTGLANSINSLTVTVNGHTASISANASAIGTANGNITTLFARYALRLDVNGYTIGYELNNNGTTGSIKFRADLFEVSSPTGGARTEFSGGNWRVYDSSGVLRVRLGVW